MILTHQIMELFLQLQERIIIVFGLLGAAVLIVLLIMSIVLCTFDQRIKQLEHMIKEREDDGK